MNSDKPAQLAVATPRKSYEKPRIVFAERVEARAMGCVKQGAHGNCQGNPAQS